VVLEVKEEPVMTKRSSLTTRQQHWVAHLQSCAERGLALSVYAAEHGLSAGALQQARTRLRRLGLWPVPVPRFVRAQTAPAPVMVRISLPNGVVVETAGSELGAVLSVAARLA
jgi:hypothetical protein